MNDQDKNSFREQLMSQEKNDNQLQKTFHLEAKRMYTEKLKKGQRFALVFTGFLTVFFTLLFWLLAKLFEDIQISQGISAIEPLRLISTWAMLLSVVLIGFALWPAIRGKIGLRFYPKAVRFVLWAFILSVVMLIFAIFDFLNREMNGSIKDEMIWVLAVVAIVIAMGVYMLLSERIDRGDMKNKAKTLELEYRIAELTEKLSQLERKNSTE